MRCDSLHNSILLNKQGDELFESEDIVFPKILIMKVKRIIHREDQIDLLHA